MQHFNVCKKYVKQNAAKDQATKVKHYKEKKDKPQNKKIKNKTTAIKMYISWKVKKPAWLSFNAANNGLLETVCIYIVFTLFSNMYYSTKNTIWSYVVQLNIVKLIFT